MNPRLAANRSEMTGHSAGLRFGSPSGRGKRVWDFSSSSNLYVLSGQPLLYTKAVENPHYLTQLDLPLANTIRKSLSPTGLVFRPNVRMVDLGPGNATKSVPVAESIRNRCEHFTYTPVDISPAFLRLACDRIGHMKGVTVQSRLELFESLSREDLETRESAQLVISIGPTFMNFEGKRICRLLFDLMKPGDLCLISAQYRHSTAGDRELLDPYITRDVERFNFSILDYLGFKRREVEYFVRLVDASIQMGFVVKSASKYLRSLGFRRGDLILTARSHRYSLRKYQSLLRSVFATSVHTVDQAHSIVVSWCTRGV